MKNLFKNLMLVAVAAMGFTACEQVNDDVNATNETFTVNIVGEFADDTRSGFDGKNDAGTGYKSAWDGNETAVFSLDEAALVDDTNTYTDGGNKASFAPKFAANNGSTIYAFSPKGVYNSSDDSKCKGGVTGIKANEDYAYVVVPAEQTPEAESVDPAAHILAGKADFAANVNMTFNHVVAYGKMTIKNFAGDIDKVEITASEPLAGISCKYYYNEGNLNNANVKTITLNADNVEGNVFWFGCAPADLSDGTLTVKVYSGEDTYTKELAITGKTDENGEKIEFKFQQGHVASFGVNMQGVEADAKAPVPSTTIEDGNYVIAGYVDGKYYALPNANKTSNGTIAHSEVTVIEGKVSADAAAGYVWTVAAAEGGYTFFNGEHYLTAAESNGAKLKTQTDAVAWALGESGDYGYKFISPKASDRYLSCRINNSFNVFGAYKNYGDDEYFGVHLLPIDGKVKTALVAPVVTATAEGTTINVAWEAVDGAKDYTITINGGVPETITATSKEFTGLEYDTNYIFTVVANPTDTEAYTSSPVATAEAHTGVDPNATETIDVINLEFIGIESYPSYTSWSGKTGISDAVYAGQSHKNGDAIQLRATNPSGIVTTTSGGNIKKVVVEWASNTTNTRTLTIYGKNTAYSSPADLYSNATKGESLGTIVKGTSTELEVVGDYAYIGFLANSAIYINEIKIYWESDGLTAQTLSFPQSVYTITMGDTFDVPALSGAQTTVTYTSSNTDVATVNANSGAVTVMGTGTTTITASAIEANGYRAAEASYTLTVNPVGGGDQPGTGAAKFVKVTSAPSDWSGTYLIVYEDGNVAFDGSLTDLDTAKAPVSVTITNGEIDATDKTKAITFDIAKSGSNYTIKSKSGYYIGQTSNANGLQCNPSTTYANTISINADGSVNLVSGGAYLRYNSASDQLRFRYYKSGTYTNQKAIQLYKLSE